VAYLSPGVYIKEIDNSAIVPNVSNSMAFFAGEFYKGPIEQPFIITNKGELEEYFGEPDDNNYNQWYQCYKFFDYSNQLTISRVYTEDQKYDLGITVNVPDGGSEIRDIDSEIIKYISLGTKLNIGSSTEEIIVTDIYQDIGGNYVLVFDPITNALNGTLYAYVGYKNGSINAYQEDGSHVKIPQAQIIDLYKNEEDFYAKEDLIVFDNGVKIKFIAKDAGIWANEIEIAVANPVDFMDYVDLVGNQTPTLAEAFPGISLGGLFDYPPVDDEIAIIVRRFDQIETFIVSFDKNATDSNNKSKYIENVINENSNLIYAVDNVAITSKIDLTQPTNGGDVAFQTYVTSTLYRDSQGNLVGEGNSPIMEYLSIWGGLQIQATTGDIYNAYFEVENKELFDIDVVIGNERDEGAAALTLADTRADCIAFIGARYNDIVGKRSAEAVRNVVNYVKTGGVLRTMFGAFFGNYFKIYDNYAKKYRYINVAGDMAGLRCQTNTNRASWWASAGLQRGQIRNIDRISYSPNQAQRDELYKNNINPIVNFPGEGNLVWGQKTLLNYASSFDRINVRGLFNTLERAMAKAAKSQVFEFNDAYTRNSILAMFNPFLSSVKAGRGVEDFLVVCDETNNTPDVISRNELHVDIYIKPMYAAEFIQLTFTNIGTRSFATVVGA